MAETFAREYDAMQRALRLAATPGIPTHPNPRVGCVLLDPHGVVVGEGFHRGAGQAHAEVEALRMAGELARGATAVATLEPCNHVGRTGPCAQTLVEAGVAKVVVAQRDPNPVAGGGLETLAAAGVEIEHGLLVDEARALNPAWTFAHENRRPFVTWKYAATLDGRSAAADGTSRWISSLPARRDTHALRSDCDVVMVGTNTVEADDPQLTVRDDDDRPLDTQPLRVVMGERDLDSDRRIFDDTAETVHLRTKDPAAALAVLYSEHGRQHVLLEGGPTLAAAFLRAGVVDEVVTYVAPLLLGAGKPAVGALRVRTLAKALTFAIADVSVIGEGREANVRIRMTPTREES